MLLYAHVNYSISCNFSIYLSYAHFNDKINCNIYIYVSYAHVNDIVSCNNYIYLLYAHVNNIVSCVLSTETLFNELDNKSGDNKSYMNNIIHHEVNILTEDFSMVAQQTRDIHPRLVQCCPTVCDAGPTLNQPRVSVSCTSMAFTHSVITHLFGSFTFLDVLPYITARWI